MATHLLVALPTLDALNPILLVRLVTSAVSFVLVATNFLLVVVRDEIVAVSCSNTYLSLVVAAASLSN